MRYPELSKINKRVRWFNLPKAPLSGYANRNLVLRQARGRYIAHAQHDDIFFPDHLSQLITAIEASGAEWCYSRPLWCTPEGFSVPFAVNLTNPDELHHFLSTENHVPSCCVLHTKRALERVGFWPEESQGLRTGAAGNALSKPARLGPRPIARKRPHSIFAQAGSPPFNPLAHSPSLW